MSKAYIVKINVNNIYKRKSNCVINYITPDAIKYDPQFSVINWIFKKFIILELFSIKITMGVRYPDTSKIMIPHQ